MLKGNSGMYSFLEALWGGEPPETLIKSVPAMEKPCSSLKGDLHMLAGQDTVAHGRNSFAQFGRISQNTSVVT